ncbi:activator of Hsp90 ATPase-like protein [Chryseobacterium sp. CBTAP 102]|uniref:SRPBCC family protein n=1 Tax=Chryseobacterium sp. CBTAP 102 TaxID=2135644 RepID=UPI000D75D439|nr:SRPBCC domain-containing protein [Chryseobacterium sp. CBTAP 102]PXW14922.1 activator of Hsp90 ATPase-like protein [Chryseobacterium sp. CBTAP 102]
MKTINTNSVENYMHILEVNTTADKVYYALTYEIPLWWTELFEGSSSKVGNLFTIRFGDQIHKTMRVEELTHNTKIVWLVEDSLIALPELNNQTEWIGTTIVWEIKEKKEIIQIKLTHIGLNPDIECYEICSGGWLQFLGSLKKFLETGKGTPYKK